MSALRAYLLGHTAMEQTRYVRLAVPPHMGRYALHIAYQVFPDTGTQGLDRF